MEDYERSLSSSNVYSVLEGVPFRISDSFRPQSSTSMVAQVQAYNVERPHAARFQYDFSREEAFLRKIMEEEDRAREEALFQVRRREREEEALLEAERIVRERREKEQAERERREKEQAEKEELSRKQREDERKQQVTLNKPKENEPVTAAQNAAGYTTNSSYYPNSHPQDTQSIGDRPRSAAKLDSAAILEPQRAIATPSPPTILPRLFGKVEQPADSTSGSSTPRGGSVAAYGENAGLDAARMSPPSLVDIKQFEEAEDVFEKVERGTIDDQEALRSVWEGVERDREAADINRIGPTSIGITGSRLSGDPSAAPRNVSPIEIDQEALTILGDLDSVIRDSENNHGNGRHENNEQPNSAEDSFSSKWEFVTPDTYQKVEDISVTGRNTTENQQEGASSRKDDLINRPIMNSMPLWPGDNHISGHDEVQLSTMNQSVSFKQLSDDVPTRGPPSPPPPLSSMSSCSVSLPTLSTNHFSAPPDSQSDETRPPAPLIRPPPPPTRPKPNRAAIVERTEAATIDRTGGATVDRTGAATVDRTGAVRGLNSIAAFNESETPTSTPPVKNHRESSPTDQVAGWQTKLSPHLRPTSANANELSSYDDIVQGRKLQNSSILAEQDVPVYLPSTNLNYDREEISFAEGEAALAGKIIVDDPSKYVLSGISDRGTQPQQQSNIGQGSRGQLPFSYTSTDPNRYGISNSSQLPSANRSTAKGEIKEVGGDRPSVSDIEWPELGSGGAVEESRGSNQQISPPPIPPRRHYPAHVGTTPTRARPDSLSAQLCAMGFSKDHIPAAIDKYGEDSKKVIDHLCMLNQWMEKGHSGSACQSALLLFESEPEKIETYIHNFSKLAEIGFPEEAIQNALIASQLDTDAALDSLMQSSP